MTLEVAAPPAADTPADDAAIAAAAATEAPIDANAADSSAVDAKDAKEPVDLLSVIKSAVETPAAATDPSAVVGDEVVDADAEAAAALAAKEADADADLPFHNHPRWKEVISERDSFRDDAANYGKITGFMDLHGLTPEEVGEGFDIMAAIKSGDPAKLTEARDYFHTRLGELDAMLGNVLPDDLLVKVEAGELDDEGAQEIARARASATLLKDQAAARDAKTAEADKDKDATAALAARVAAVEGWEKTTKATDPDYPKKAALVLTTCQAIVQRTGQAPVTAEDAVALADQALAEVNAHFKGLLPPKRAVTPGPTGASAPTVGEPKTLREAINAAVGG